MFTRTLLHRRGICTNPACHAQRSLLKRGCCFSTRVSSGNLSGGTYHYLDYSLTRQPVPVLFLKDFSQSIELQAFVYFIHKTGSKIVVWTRLLLNGCLVAWRLTYKCGQLEFCSWSPGGHLNMGFSLPSNLSDDFNLLMKLVKKSFERNKLNGKQQQLWSCFAFCF